MGNPFKHFDEISEAIKRSFHSEAPTMVLPEVPDWNLLQVPLDSFTTLDSRFRDGGPSNFRVIPEIASLDLFDLLPAEIIGEIYPDGRLPNTTFLIKVSNELHHVTINVGSPHVGRKGSSSKKTFKISSRAKESYTNLQEKIMAVIGIYDSEVKSVWLLYAKKDAK